jgi:hypothetical protein
MTFARQYRAIRLGAQQGRSGRWEARLAGERKQMGRMSAGLAKRTLILPWLTRPPIGFVELSKLVSERHRAAAVHA